jgi:hypothetical protein
MAIDDARARLALSRQAILEHVARKERRHDPRESGPQGPRMAADGRPRQEPPPQRARGDGLFARAASAAGIWWRHHPAHMAVEIATPVLATLGRRKPAVLLGGAALVGAAFMFARPWRLISATTLLFAVVKVTNLPGLLMSALAAADYERDHEGPGG